MTESTTPAQCSDADWKLARNCGLFTATPGTNTWDAALGRFADGVRSSAPQPQGGALTRPQVEMLRALLMTTRDRLMAVGFSDVNASAAFRRVESALDILAQSAPPAPQQAGDGLTEQQRTLEWVKEVLARHIDIDCPSCDCKECEQCGKMPKDCSGTECARTCQCTPCDHCQATGALNELRAILAAPAAAPAPDQPIPAPINDAGGPHLSGQIAAPRQPGEMGAGVPFRDAVEAMVHMLEEGEWAEHVASTTGKGDPLAQRLEDAITNLINEASDGRELASGGSVDGCDRGGNSSVGVARVAASAQQDEREAVGDNAVDNAIEMVEGALELCEGEDAGAFQIVKRALLAATAKAAAFESQARAAQVQATAGAVAWMLLATTGKCWEVTTDRVDMEEYNPELVVPLYRHPSPAVESDVEMLRAVAKEYDECIRHMDAGGDFFEFQARFSAMSREQSGGDRD